MFDYLNSVFGFDDSIVEEGTIVNLSKYYSTDILYEYSPYLVLPNNLDEFRNMHKPKFWYNIKRSNEILVNDFGGLTFKVLLNENALNILNDLREIFLLKWQDDYTSFCWKTDKGFNNFKSNVENLIRRDFTFEVSVLLDVSENNILAYSLGFHINGVYYFFMHNINPKFSKSKYSLGTVFLKYLLEENIESKVSNTFDFMLGTSEYKLKWTKEIKPIFWRVKTPRFWYLFPFHILKVKLFTFKIFVQKNKYIRTILKQIFFYLDSTKYFNTPLRFLEKKLFRM